MKRLHTYLIGPRSSYRPALRVSVRNSPLRNRGYACDRRFFVRHQATAHEEQQSSLKHRTILRKSDTASLTVSKRPHNYVFPQPLVPLMLHINGCLYVFITRSERQSSSFMSPEGTYMWLSSLHLLWKDNLYTLSSGSAQLLSDLRHCRCTLY